VPEAGPGDARVRKGARQGGPETAQALPRGQAVSGGVSRREPLGDWAEEPPARQADVRPRGGALHFFVAGAGEALNNVGRVWRTPRPAFVRARGAALRRACPCPDAYLAFSWRWPPAAPRRLPPTGPKTRGWGSTS